MVAGLYQGDDILAGQLYRDYFMSHGISTPINYYITNQDSMECHVRVLLTAQIGALPKWLSSQIKTSEIPESLTIVTSNTWSFKGMDLEYFFRTSDCWKNRQFIKKSIIFIFWRVLQLERHTHLDKMWSGNIFHVVNRRIHSWIFQAPFAMSDFWKEK